MEIKTTYIGTLNGVHGIWCGFLPEGVKVSEKRRILYPAKGYKLQDKEGNLLDYVVNPDKDYEENYIEVEYDDNKRNNAIAD
jgi:hypothetical protein